MDERTAQGLWFVVPAWQRFALSAVCFDQWLAVREELARHAIDLQVVVVSDDANLELARERGFHTVERDNAWLGRRFNDGIEYACRHGADWVAPVGTDTWVAADYFLPLPEPHVSRRGRLATVVRYDRLAELHVTNVGVGPFLYHRSQLEHCGFRPCDDFIHKGCDTSTILGVAEGHSIVWDERRSSPYQHVGFRAKPHLTKYSSLVTAYGLREIHDPWRALAEHVPADLVARARDAIRGELQVAAA